MRVMVLAVVAGLARPLMAQVAPPPDTAVATAPDSAPVAVHDSAGPTGNRMAPILDYTFSGPGEYVRLFLAGDVVYRARVGSTDVDLQLTAVVPSTIPPTLIALARSASASGEREYLVRPGVDGEYEFRTQFNGVPDTNSIGVPASPSTGSTRLRLFRDARETARWGAAVHPSWSLGILFAGGGGASYPIEGTATPTGGSGLFETCLELRYGGGLGGLNGCVLGVSSETRPGAPRIFWVYAEPRYRLIGAGRGWDGRLDAGVLFRAGFGQVDRVDRQPATLAPGAYASILLFHRPHWPRLVFEASARYACIISGNQPTQAAAQGALGLGLF